MLNRSSPESIGECPVAINPFVDIWEKGLGNFPVNNNWLLLNGNNFATLSGMDFAFLG